MFAEDAHIDVLIMWFTIKQWWYKLRLTSLISSPETSSQEVILYYCINSHYSYTAISWVAKEKDIRRQLQKAISEEAGVVNAASWKVDSKRMLITTRMPDMYGGLGKCEGLLKSWPKDMSFSEYGDELTWK